MEVIAKAKYIRRTPRKARLIADAVRGMPVAEALAFLEFSSRHAALDVAKVIKSAAANAEHNFNLNREDLVVKALMVDEGPTMKRIRPVSRGMAHQYFHRTCHITAVVEDREEAVPVVRAPRATTPTTTATPRAPRTRTPRSTE
jgi:large subunit ribosomal protein L22